MPKFNNRDEIKVWVKEQLEIQKQRDKEQFRKRWDNLGTFEKIEDVPDIPVLNTFEELHTVYVPKLIAAGAIPKKELIDGQYYLGRFRCTHIARWNAKKQVFEYVDFGWNTGIDTTRHFEDDIRWATFVPIKIITEFDDKYKIKNDNRRFGY